MRTGTPKSLCVIGFAVLVLVAAGCRSDESGASARDQPASGSIGTDEVNRFELDVFGTIAFRHTGGLLCSVDDGALVFDFSVDAGDGDYEYGAVFPNFDPSLSELRGELTLTYLGEHESVAAVNMDFVYGPPPDHYPGVVRAAGNFAGPLTGDAGTAELAGSYACFLMDSEVGS